LLLELSRAPPRVTIRPISNVYTPMKPTRAASMTQKSSSSSNPTTSSPAETSGGALERMKRVLALQEAKGQSDGLGTRMLRAEIERWENGEAEKGFANQYITKPE
jgi:hypothetical protein